MGVHMLQTWNIVLMECGQQTGAGEKQFLNGRKGDCILLMSAVRAIIRVNGRQYYMQPFTFLLYPFETAAVRVETQGDAALRFMHLRFSEAYTAMLRNTRDLMRETHTLANPLAVEEIWKLLLTAASGAETALAKETCSCALELLLCLIRQTSDGTIARAAEIPHYDKLSKIRHQIYQHPEESWFIQDICEEIGISRPYFHKLYLAAFGTTCTQDVIASRIARSKRFLEMTDDPISSVAQRCGFETDVYFMRQFKRHVGMTPTAYRRIYRQSASH